jgi:hypothetical protein
MAYTRGSSSNIIVGAAALFTYSGGPIGLVADSEAANYGKILSEPAGTSQADTDLPEYAVATSYKDTLETDVNYRNVGYTMNGLEIQFQPDFGEVQVDQVLDVAKLYKQGMQVNLNTAFAESTLENLLFSIAADTTDLDPLTGTGIGSGSQIMNISAGDIGDIPVERGLVAVGPGTGSAQAATEERVYIAYRALSIDNVTVAAKRDEATMFEVSFRLLPNDNASYGKIVDRVIAAV